MTTVLWVNPAGVGGKRVEYEETEIAEKEACDCLIWFDDEDDGNDDGCPTEVGMARGHLTRENQVSKSKDVNVLKESAFVMAGRIEVLRDHLNGTHRAAITKSSGARDED